MLLLDFAERLGKIVLFVCCCETFLANWIADGTNSSERLIINVCRNISSVNADASCPLSAAVCLVSK